MGLDTSSKWITSNQTSDSFKKMAWVVGGVLFIIIGLKFMLSGDPDYGTRSHSVLNKLRADMLSYDMMKSVLFLLIGGGMFYMSRMGWIGRQALAGIIITASVIDMGIVDWQIIEPDKKSYRQSTMTKKSVKSAYLSEDEVIRFLKQDTSKYRILPLGNLGNENRWSAFQIESVMGYHPAKIFRYNKVKDEVGWNSLGVLKMLNVKYIITLEELPHPAFEHIFSGKLFHQGKYQEANVYQYKYAIPRTFFTEELEVIQDFDDQLNALRDPGFNPRKTAIVEQLSLDIKYNPNSKAEITYWSPGKIEFQVSTPTNQFLILSEIYYEVGWEITSHPNWDIHPVNTILRGIYIPVGEHHIVMEFIPDDIRYGTIMTWSSTGIVILLILLGFISKRKEYENLPDTV
jgi:hypothetical protein